MPDENEDQGGDLSQEDMDDLGTLDGNEDDDPDEGGEDGDGKEYVAPSAEEWAKVQRKLKRQEDRITKLVGKPPAKGRGKSPDQQLLEQVNGKGDADEDDESGEATRWRTIAAQQSAATQLAAAGFSGTAKQAARLTRLLDLADAEPDRHGAFDFEDEIEELAEEYPSLFTASKGTGRPPAPRVRRADDRRTPKKDATQATTDALLRGAGYR